MRVNARQIWQTALGELQTTIAGSNFQTWLRNTTGQQLRGDTFVITAPSTFSKEWIENRFRTEIETVLARVVGRRLAVQVVVEKPAARLTHPDQTPLPFAESTPAEDEALTVDGPD